MNPYAQFPFIGQAPNDSRREAGRVEPTAPDLWISGLAYRAIDFLWEAGRHLAAALRTYNKRRQAIDQLSGLDDGTLKDIGLHRSEIRSAVEEVLVLEAAVEAEIPVGPPERVVRFVRRDSRERATEHPTRAAA